MSDLCLSTSQLRPELEALRHGPPKARPGVVHTRVSPQGIHRRPRQGTANLVRAQPGRMDDLARFRQVAEAHWGLASAAMLTAGGVSRMARWRAVHSGQLTVVAAGVYAEHRLPPLGPWLVSDQGIDPGYLMRVRAQLLRHGDAAAAAGRTAAVLRGWGLLVEPRRTIELSVPHGRGASGGAGASVQQHRTHEVDWLTLVPGTEPVPVTTPLTTVLACVLTLPRTEAITVVDSALRSEDVQRDQVESAVSHLPGHRRASHARKVVRRCDQRSGSVLESVARCLFVDAGLAGFTTQLVLRHDPELRVDFGWEAVRLVVETDGERWHRQPARDQARDNWLASRGWRVLRFTWDEILRRPDHVLEMLRTALRDSPPVVTSLGWP